MRLLVLTLLLWACDDPAGGDAPGDVGGVDSAADADVVDGAGERDAAPPDATPTPPDAWVRPGPDESDRVFEIGRLVEVDLEIAAEDWNALRIQRRGGFDVRGADCLDEPFPSPYDWFRATVTVDGARYPDVGVRKKGFYGSVSDARPSLKIRFDKYREGQTHETHTRLTLNNGRQDPSRLRTCLAYSVFADAGLPAPRCNFAHLRVNGRDMGVFAHVESLKRPFLRRHFQSDEGHLYEGTLSDFRPEYRGTIEQKTDEETPYTAPIDRLVEAAAVPDAELLPALEAVLDLDRFLSFWALEVLTAHWDGYAGNTNNFWFYDDPTSGRVVFIPWGPDATFRKPRLLFEGQEAPWSVMATGLLARRLYLHPEGQARYLERLDALLEQTWDEGRLLARVEAWEALVRPAVLPENRAPFEQNLGELRAFVRAQRDRVLFERWEGPAPWEAPLRGSLCQVEIGALSARFETTLGTWPTDDAFATGSGTFAGEVDGRSLDTATVGAAAGLAQDGAGELVIPAVLGPGAVVFVYVRLHPALLTPGEVSMEEVDCSLNALVDGQVQRLGGCLDGGLRFEAAGRSPGAAIRGALEVSLWGPTG